MRRLGLEIQREMNGLDSEGGKWIEQDLMNHEFETAMAAIEIGV